MNYDCAQCDFCEYIGTDLVECNLPDGLTEEQADSKGYIIPCMICHNCEHHECFDCPYSDSNCDEEEEFCSNMDGFPEEELDPADDNWID